MSLDLTATEALKAFTLPRPEDEPSDAPPLAFPTALAQSRLDGSRESLERVQHLLNAVRTRYPQSEAAFLAEASQQQFLKTLGFYLGALAARESRQTMRWLSPEDVARRFPKAPRPPGFAGSMACLLGSDTLFWPLPPLLACLFGAPPCIDLATRLQAYLTGHPGPWAFRKPGPAQLAALPVELSTQGRTLRLAGFVLAHAVLAWRQHPPVGPLLGLNLPGGRNSLEPLAPISSGNPAASPASSPAVQVATARSRLVQNLAGAQAAALVFPGRVPLADGPQDALLLEIHHYPTPTDLQRDSLHWTLGLPLREAKAGIPAAIHGLKALTLPGPTAVLAALPTLLDHFFAGAHEHGEAARAWLELLDESR